MKRLIANIKDDKKFICHNCFNDMNTWGKQYELVKPSDYFNMPYYNENKDTFMCENCKNKVSVDGAVII